MTLTQLKDYIRDIPDFPRPGILFRDITPLLNSAEAFRETIDRITEHYAAHAIDAIVGIEARGFLLASPLAYCLGKPLVPVRKVGKLPFETHHVTYALEYGFDSVEVHKDAISNGQNVLLIDDLLATGGTMSAAARLVEQAGGNVAGIAVMIELADLNGAEKLREYELFSLIQY